MTEAELQSIEAQVSEMYSGEEWPDITIRGLVAEVRRLKQSGLAIAKAVGVDGEVATITTRNPQAFVINSPRRVSSEEAAHWNGQWKEMFAGTSLAKIPVVIMHNGMELSVIDQVEGS